MAAPFSDAIRCHALNRFSAEAGPWWCGYRNPICAIFRGYACGERIDREFDLRGPDAGALVRMIHGNRGTLSRGKRKQFSHVPDSAIERIESIVRDTFVGQGWPIA